MSIIISAATGRPGTSGGFELPGADGVCRAVNDPGSAPFRTFASINLPAGNHTAEQLAISNWQLANKNPTADER